MTCSSTEHIVSSPVPGTDPNHQTNNTNTKRRAVLLCCAVLTT
ncbi:hypothetical protein CKAH01_09755 [Colletotrichum kahawae]|uniref:Uncharacterized protein n=1 Tax=Colletotrichum kahawae TaxID=34407 RepID=A0AAD9Y063_COLKA|nr:hypothetical protein CKAH01_09755 [Colletotrichum kahawae]